MINTSRINSGFDVEFQLGSSWFLTALRGLHERGLLIPQGSIPWITDTSAITIDSVDIIFDPPGRDLNIVINIGGLIPYPIKASISLSSDGSELIIDTSISGLSTRVPFNIIGQLAGKPEIVKLKGDDQHENVIALLANLNIRASSQDGPPLPSGQHLERGDSGNALSFLPVNKHIALGISNTTLQRFANDVWHNQLSDAQGNHPFPDSDERMGDWKSVSMSVSSKKIRVMLKAVAEVDTPVIDIIPDPKITITVDLIPKLDNGKLSFEIETDSDIDFGILGKLLAFFLGALVGFIIGLFTGNPIGGSITGAIAGPIILEVAEVIIGKVIAKEIQAKINGKPLTQFYKCKNNVIHFASIKDQGQGLNLGVLDALPASIPIYFDNPDPLYQRSVLITSVFDQVSIDSGGFAVEGSSTIIERYTPEDASIVEAVREEDKLAGLKYKTADGTEVTLTIEEILDRVKSDDVPEPIKLFTLTRDDILEYKLDGKIPVACMHPVAIHRKNTIITDIRFSTGAELKTAETIMLQDAGALILPWLQLIHPSKGNPYYRAPADHSIENNFESLPRF